MIGKYLFHEYLYMKICAIFALYILYKTNNDTNKVLISIDIDSLLEIKNILNLCYSHGINEGCDIIKIMFSKKYFIYSYNTGLKSIRLNRNGDPMLT